MVKVLAVLRARTPLGNRRRPLVRTIRRKERSDKGNTEEVNSVKLQDSSNEFSIHPQMINAAVINFHEDERLGNKFEGKK